MHNFKRINETMTEEAFQILYMLIPAGQRLKPAQISDEMGMEGVRVELILQQMIEFKVAHVDVWGRYMLTPDYRRACGK
jgi:DNA-binding IclR family transcriptional regulator